MNNDARNGCAIACGLVIGMIFVSWLLTVGIIWLICLLLSGVGVVFDLGIATAVWLILWLLGMFFGSRK